MELVNALGAMPLLMDTAEADGIFTAMHILPQLAAAALLETTLDQPGWQEARKLAGRPFAGVTAGAAYHDDADSLGQSSLHGRENVLRLLDAYINSLINLREDIEASDRDTLRERLDRARKGRARWLDERIGADWLHIPGQPANAPSFGERFNQMFLGSLLKDRQKQRK
jgi:prephenate dehydrogenase